jgi:signal transduction histidine kinase
MAQTAVRRWWRFWRPASLVVLLLSIQTATAVAQVNEKRALVLYATRRDAQISIVGEREISRILDAAVPKGVDLYSEYIDRARFPDASYRAGFADFLRVKYAGTRFDVVISMHDVATDFVADYRSSLFAGTPLVFFSAQDTPLRPPNSTGIAAPINLAGTLDLALRLQPDARHVFVISGSDGATREFLDAARVQFQALQPRLEFNYLTAFNTPAFDERLRNLPPHSLVYFLGVNRDGAGQGVVSLNYLDHVAAVANAPVYSWVNSVIGHGTVGGHLKNQTREVSAVAELATRVLRGESAEAIPLVRENLNENEVDSRVLSRWGLDESRLPADTRLRFREPSIWERFRWYIVSVVAVLATQSALLILVLVQSRRRRVAEEDVRRGNDRVRALASRLLNAQDNERSTVACELHDDIGQRIVLLALDLDQLSGDGAVHDRDVVDRLSRGMQELGRAVHDLSHRLHPAKLQMLGLVPTLQRLRDEACSRGLNVRFMHADVPSALPPALSVSLYRVAQEALQNAVKHSGAQTVTLRLSGSSTNLNLRVDDDGIGFDPLTTPPGLGLATMQERVEAFGGAMSIRSRKGRGTHLLARFPLSPKPGEAETVNASPPVQERWQSLRTRARVTTRRRTPLGWPGPVAAPMKQSRGA